jgi:hypothetical protein
MPEHVQIEWGTKRTNFVPVTLTGGATETVAIDLAGWTIAGVISPSGGFSGDLDLEASDKPGGTYLAVQDDVGNQVTVTAVAGAYVVLGADALVKMRGLRYVKFTYADPTTNKQVTLVTIGI